MKYCSCSHIDDFSYIFWAFQLEWAMLGKLVIILITRYNRVMRFFNSINLSHLRVYRNVARSESAEKLQMKWFYWANSMAALEYLFPTDNLVTEIFSKILSRNLNSSIWFKIRLLKTQFLRHGFHRRFYTEINCERNKIVANVAQCNALWQQFVICCISNSYILKRKQANLAACYNGARILKAVCTIFARTVI